MFTFPEKIQNNQSRLSRFFSSSKPSPVEAKPVKFLKVRWGDGVMEMTEDYIEKHFNEHITQYIEGIEYVYRGGTMKTDDLYKNYNLCE